MWTTTGARARAPKPYARARARSHAQTRAHTHHEPTQAQHIPPILSHTRARARTHTHTHTHTHVSPQKLSHTQTITHSLTYERVRARAYTHASPQFSLTYSLTHTHTHTRQDHARPRDLRGRAQARRDLVQVDDPGRTGPGRADPCQGRPGCGRRFVSAGAGAACGAVRTRNRVVEPLLEPRRGGRRLRAALAGDGLRSRGPRMCKAGPRRRAAEQSRKMHGLEKLITTACNGLLSVFTSYGTGNSRFE